MFIAIKNVLFEYIISLKNHPRGRVFHNVNLHNFENVLQRNLRTDRAKFGKFNWLMPTMVVPLWDDIPVCPKKVWICHWTQTWLITDASLTRWKITDGKSFRGDGGENEI